MRRRRPGARRLLWKSSDAFCGDSDSNSPPGGVGWQSAPEYLRSHGRVLPGRRKSCIAGVHELQQTTRLGELSALSAD